MNKALERSIIALAVLLAVCGSIYSQSTDQLFPTPVRSPEILSSIKARTLGDPRITTHYYTFEGEQGDVFINVQSRNFTGDIDIFVLQGQVPMTKMVIYGDQPETETGRVVYLRKPERLLLRIQGRSPGDEDASVRVKFAGSWSVSKLDDSGVPAVPTVETTAETNVRVNSVGTILEVIPKVKPTPDAVAETAEPTAEPPVSAVPPAETKAEEKKSEEIAVKDPEVPEKKIEVVVTDPVAEKKAEPTAARSTRSRTRRTTRRVRTPDAAANNEAEEKPEAARPPRTTAARRTTAPKEVEEPKVDPMANIRLVVYFKDGSTVDRPMSEVLRFSVERAILTVISKNGTIGRYKMAEVSRVSIE